VQTARERAILDGHINGKKAGIFVDTGAWTSLIQRAAAIRLGLERTPARGWIVRGVGGETMAELATIDELRIGEATRRGWRVLVAGEHDLGRDISLILGDDFFEQVDVEFDIPHSAIRLFQPQGCDGVSIAYWAKSGAGEVGIEPGTRIFVRVTIDGHPVRAMLDSGAGRSALALPVARAIGRTPDSPDVQPAGCSAGIGKDLVDSWIAPFETFTIGDETIRNPRLYLTELWKDSSTRTGSRLDPGRSEEPAEMLLGFDFLKTHRVLVSRSQRKLYFTYEGGMVFPSISGAACPGRTAPATADAALGEFDAALARDPRDAKALFGRARLLQQRNELDRALADYDAALAIEPRNGLALWYRGNIHFVRKDYDRAIGDYEAAMDGGTRDAGLYVARADVLRMKGERERAAADYARALELDPRNPTSYLRRGAFYLANDELDKAQADLDAAVALDKVGALADRAALSVRRGDEARALSDLDTLLQLAPGRPNALGMRGLLHFRAGRYAAAEQDFAAGLAKSPTHFMAVWRFLARSRAGADARAQLATDEATAKGPTWNAAIARFYRGEIDRAQLYAAAADPDATTARDQLCEADFYVAQGRLIAGDTREARVLLEKARDGCPHDFVEYTAAVAELKRMP